jgi:hypothetical protein
LSLSAAREKVRTAQALREMPRICAAFADGRLSYSKVRALTRVVQAHDEDLLLAYALQANAAQVEGRCRQIRNATPESVGGAWRAPGRSDLPIDTVKRLTCDGSLVTIVEDDHGTPLDVGRKRLTVSTPLKRALWSRDRGCSFPKMSPYALRRRASHSPLGGRRRHEPREPHAAVLAPSHVAARGPVHDPARSRRCDLLPARGWAGDSAARLSAR